MISINLNITSDIDVTDDVVIHVNIGDNLMLDEEVIDITCCDKKKCHDELCCDDRCPLTYCEGGFKHENCMWTHGKEGVCGRKDCRYIVDTSNANKIEEDEDDEGILIEE